MDYKHCFMAHRQQPTQQTLTKYIDSHNAYVQQVSDFHIITMISGLIQFNSYSHLIWNQKKKNNALTQRPLF